MTTPSRHTPESQTTSPTTAPAVAGTAPTTTSAVQLKASLRGHDFATQVQMLAPQGPGNRDVHAAAAKGISGAGGSVAYKDKNRQSFGGYDISNVTAHTDGAAAQGAAAMGADAYATGNHVVLGQGGGDLHTADHETAHVVQQRAGVSPSGGGGGVQMQECAPATMSEPEADSSKVETNSCEVGVDIPNTRPATEADAAVPAQAAPGPDNQQASTPTSLPDLAESDVASRVQSAVHTAAALGGMAPAAAYQALKLDTEAKRGDLTNKDTKRALANIQAKYGELDPASRPSIDGYISVNFFKEYWMLHCDQYANALMAKINGGGLPSLNALRDRTNKTIDAKGGDPGGPGAATVAGRDITYRGETMATLGARLASENAEAGIGVHVKLRHDSDRPYDPGQSDELHHWFVYIGDGKFADSFKSAQSGAAANSFMVAWMNKDFYNRGRAGERFDFSRFHTEEYCDAASMAEFRTLMEGAESQKEELNTRVVMPGDQAARNAKKRDLRRASPAEARVAAARLIKEKKLPKPKSGFQPRVSAVYRPQKAQR